MHEIVTRVEIAASAARVWQALADFSAYRRWNPVIRWISGPLEPGGVVSVYFQPRRSLPVWFRARLSVVRPEAEFRWTGKLLFAPLFSGDHYYILRPLAPDRVELIHGEVFQGVLAPLLYRLLAGYNRAGFEEMNAALKAYVEGTTGLSAAEPVPAVSPESTCG